MQLSLLEIVQDMLSAIDAEQVPSVTSTTESNMCVQIANRAYEEMMSKRRWRHLRQYSVLQTTSNKHELVGPASTIAIDPEAVWYGTQGEERQVYWLDPEAFLRMTIARNTDDSNVEKVNNIKVYNDRDPLFFTSDNDSTLTFDAIPSTSGLLGNESLAIIYRLPTSRLDSDAEVFDLPAQAFPALSSLCISKALNELKGDTEGSNLERRNYISLVGSLARTGRYVDVLDDKRKNIISRRTMSRFGIY